jgi:chitodextrinase
VPFFSILIVGAACLLTVSGAVAQNLTASVTLTWTATGDDGYTGRAAKYDLRYSSKAMATGDTMTWWGSAAVVNMTGRVPSASGAKDSVKVAGLVIGLKYYAILRAADASGNWSGFSNVATIDLTHGATAVDSELVPAARLTVGAPYPSPTRGSAQVSFTLGRSGTIQAAVYDARGRRIRALQAGSMEAGAHMLQWDGNADGGAHAAAGVYWIQVAAADVRKTVKLVVVR